MTPAGLLFTALGFLSGCAVLTWAAGRRGLHWTTIQALLLVAVWGGVLGAYGLQSAVGPPGRTILGGLLGGWLAVEVWKKRRGLRRSTGDLFALAVPAAEFWGRLGCYCNGCCYGVPWNGPWAIWQHECWRQPTQLYASGLALLIFALMLWQFRAAPNVEGRMFGMYLILGGAARFAVEGLRVGSPAVLGLRPTQWLCLALIVVGIRILRRRGSPLQGGG